MPYSVLIVDDSPAMRSFVRRVLDLSGLAVARCLEAGDGRQALGVLRRERVDIVLTDVNMPVMDGEELVRRLDSDDVLRRIPVIVVSTDRTEVRLRRMLQLGAKGYVTKPFRPETLRQEMEKVLRGVHAGC